MTYAAPTEINLADLLSPVSEAAPCGVIGEVGAAQIDRLQECLRPRPAAVRVRDGEVDVLRAEQIPQWSLLEKVAKGLFMGGVVPDLRTSQLGEGEVTVARCKHLGVAFALAYIGLNTRGLHGFAAGLDLISGLLSRYWDSVFPPADPSDTEDPYHLRFTILSPIAIEFPGPPTSAGSLVARDSWRIYDLIVSSPLFTGVGNGQLNVRDALFPWSGEVRIPLPRGVEITADRVRSAREAAGAELVSVRQAVNAACNATKAIEKIIAAAPGRLGKPSFSSLLRLLQSIGGILDGSLGAGHEPSPGLSKPSTPAEGDVRPVRSGNGVSSREEAIRQLVTVADFFRRTEPSSPIPQLLDRAGRLVGKDFLALVDDLGLGEQAVNEYRRVAGIRSAATEKPTAE